MTGEPTFGHLTDAELLKYLFTLAREVDEAEAVGARPEQVAALDLALRRVRDEVVRRSDLNGSVHVGGAR